MIRIFPSILTIKTLHFNNNRPLERQMLFRHWDIQKWRNSNCQLQRALALYRYLFHLAGQSLYKDCVTRFLLLPVFDRIYIIWVFWERLPKILEIFIELGYFSVNWPWNIKRLPFFKENKQRKIFEKILLTTTSKDFNHRIQFCCYFCNVSAIFISPKLYRHIYILDVMFCKRNILSDKSLYFLITATHTGIIFSKCWNFCKKGQLNEDS